MTVLLAVLLAAAGLWAGIKLYWQGYDDGYVDGIRTVNPDWEAPGDHSND